MKIMFSSVRSLLAALLLCLGVAMVVPVAVPAQADEAKSAAMSAANTREEKTPAVTIRDNAEAAPQSEAADEIAPSSYDVGDTFTANITVGGSTTPCVFKVQSAGAVQVGDGSSAAIDTDAAGAMVIPNTVTDEEGTTYTVGAVGNNAFNTCTQITSTGLAQNTSVTTLGYNAFKCCHALTETGLEENITITSMDGRVFEHCYGMEQAALPQHLVDAAEEPFYRCLEKHDTLKTILCGEFQTFTQLTGSDDAQAAGAITLYYRSSDTTWHGKTIADAGGVAAIEALSTATAQGGVVTNAPKNPPNVWAHLGLWKQGETVELKATEAPEGKLFDHWECSDPTVAITHAESAEATAVMGSKDVVFTAVFVDKPMPPDPPQPDTYKVVYSVSGSVPLGYTAPVDAAAYLSGSTVTLAQVPSQSAYAGYTFTGWTIDGSETARATVKDADVQVKGVWTRDLVAPLRISSAEGFGWTPSDEGRYAQDGVATKAVVATTNAAGTGVDSGDTVAQEAAATQAEQARQAQLKKERAVAAARESAATADTAQAICLAGCTVLAAIAASIALRCRRRTW